MLPFKSRILLSSRSTTTLSTSGAAIVLVGEHAQTAVDLEEDRGQGEPVICEVDGVEGGWVRGVGACFPSEEPALGVSPSYLREGGDGSRTLSKSGKISSPATPLTKHARAESLCFGVHSLRVLLAAREPSGSLAGT